jgi:hypothetical protein
MKKQFIHGEEQAHLEIRMPMTGNETLFVGNNGSYEVYRVYPDSATCSEIARFDVRQVYGRRREMGDAFVLEETPQTNYGLFLIQRYHYSPGSKKRTIGASFTQRGAHAFAKKEAYRFAKNLSRREDLADVVNRIDEDIVSIRKTVQEVKGDNKN